MLQVRSLGSSGRFLGCYAVGLLDRSTSVSIGFLVPFPNDSSFSTFVGKILTGPQDKFGDRACSHINVEGSLVHASTTVVSTTVPAVISNPSYVIVSGTSYPVPSYRMKRSNGSFITHNGLLVPPGTSSSVRLMENIVLYNKTSPKNVYEYAYYDIYVESDNGVNEVGTRYKLRTSKTFGAIWSDWSEVDTVSAAYSFDVAGTTPKYRRCINGTWGSWTTIATVLAPSALSLPEGGILTAPQAEALDYWIRRATPSKSRDLWGDLCMAALQDARALSINTGMYLYELSQMAASAKSLYSLVKGKWSSKTVASLFLTNRYGVQLTMADTLTIIDAAKRELQAVSRDYNWVRATATGVGIGKKGRFKDVFGTAVYHYKIYFRPYDHPFATGLKSLLDIDLFPTLTNVWDFVPLSFVVDWFLDIGSLFERIDTRTYAATLAVLGTLRSEKLVVSGIPGCNFPFCGGSSQELVGTWTATSYTRSRSKTLMLPRLILDAPREFSNYAELAAIITQKL